MGAKEWRVTENYLNANKWCQVEEEGLGWLAT